LVSNRLSQLQQPFPYPKGAVRLAIRLPLALYRLGLGMVIGAAPIMILTTRGRRSGIPRHTALEYRQHGSKYYLISAWGKRAQWVQNLLANPDVTIQCGNRTYPARARLVDDPGEAHRVVQLYQRQLPYIYDTLLAKIVSEPTTNPRQVLAAGEHLTIIRLDRQAEAPVSLPPLRSDLGWVLPTVTMVLTVVLGLLVATRTRRT
jgi:deazaflavin-dependent oxidoreductase (nitroreductase family)